VQIDFDPEVLPFGRLLEIFWTSHDATRAATLRQYASLVFVHTKDQEEEAIRSKKRLEAAALRPVATQILPFTGFTLAEEYHQKFYLRRDPILMKTFKELFPDSRLLTDSTAAARVNGFLAGFGDPLLFMSTTPRWGLSAEGWDRLRRIAKGRT
jgi:hypothetical protein